MCDCLFTYSNTSQLDQPLYKKNTNCHELVLILHNLSLNRQLCNIHIDFGYILILVTYWFWLHIDFGYILVLVAYWFWLHIYFGYILILVTYWNWLHIDFCYILNLVTYWFGLHIDLGYILILVTYWFWLHIECGYILILTMYTLCKYWTIHVFNQEMSKKEFTELIDISTDECERVLSASLFQSTYNLIALKSLICKQTCI